MSDTCAYWRPRCKRPCGAQSTTWWPGMCPLHAHLTMLDVDPEEGELLHKAYRATKRNQLCKHQLKASECARCLRLPLQAWEEVA